MEDIGGAVNDAYVPTMDSEVSGGTEVTSMDMTAVVALTNGALGGGLLAVPIEEDKNLKLARKLSQVNMERNKLRHATPAVEIRNAHKTYKSRKGTSVVLNGLDMTVQEGTIYSLLGSSGCGKTTTLECCVGLKNLENGDVRVFGHKPGTWSSGVPGRNVGYMPQELALYPELTISEILLYFGKLFGMSQDAINESTDFIISFLDLPPRHRRIGSLSGGQKRRVSFAVALIHSPRLLILDEPTVGVDPLLRQSIWSHLVKLVSSGETTVIITTHYVEEAKESNQIGLMRHGRLLVEDSPGSLLKAYNTNLLEDIVLKLCLQDTARDNESSSSNSDQQDYDDANKHNEGVIAPNGKCYLPQTLAGALEPQVQLKVFVPQEEEKMPDIQPIQVIQPSLELLRIRSRAMSIRRYSQMVYIDHNKWYSPFMESFERIKAMAWKDGLEFLRNILFVIFLFFLPAIQVVIVCITIGQDPKGLKFGVVNFDAENLTDCVVQEGCVGADNFTGRLSCRFLKYLGESGTLDMRNFPTEEEATRDVELVNSWGYIMFPQNYTECMKDRAIFGVHSEPETIYGSRIKFRLDQSNLQIIRETTKVFLAAFKNFLRSVSDDCNMDSVAAELPIYFDQPIYGADSVHFVDFLAPNMLLAILFFFPLVGSTMSFITEKKSGTLSRCVVAGVNTFELMSASLLVQICLLIVQIAVAFFILGMVFHIPFKGPYLGAYLICLLMGVAGMSMGYLLAALVNNEMAAVLLALGAFLPNIFLSGLLWPIEGMPYCLQILSKLLPCTFGGETLRSIMSRGVGFTHPAVWPGFMSISTWIAVYWILNIALHKYRSRKQ